MNFPVLGLLAILLFTFHPSDGQINKPSKVKEYLSLIGNVNMLCIFVETDIEDWEEEEIAAYYKEYLKAQEWLIEEAAFYDQNLVFNNDQFFLDNKKLIYLDNIKMNDRPSRTVQRVLSALEYKNFDDFLQRNNFDFENEKMKIVLMVKQNSRSHAWNYWSKDKVDLAVIYCKSTFGMRTDKYVMAHEILHQFGAWDLYFGESQTRESSRKATELFPLSIMGNTRKFKTELEVDELTAWRVGWSGMDESYRYFDPKNHREQARQEKKELMQLMNGKKSKELKFNLGGKKN